MVSAPLYEASELLKHLAGVCHVQIFPEQSWSILNITRSFSEAFLSFCEY